MIDPRGIVQHVEEATRLAGDNAWLVGYDINGIQELVTASSRPIAMRGASQTIKDFDAGNRGPLCIFAGGGRGIELARSEREACDRVKILIASFRNETHSGVLAAETVPYCRSDPAASLAWLRRRLDNAKDAALPPGGHLAEGKDGQCEDCQSLLADRMVRGKQGDRQVCARCELFIHKAREAPSSGQSLLEFASKRRLAAVSADGNNLGAFFASLATLSELAVASEGVADIFREAHERAQHELGDLKVLAPVTGGDDIRAFLAPEAVLPYVAALARGVEQGAMAAGNFEGVLGNGESIFARLGVGIGAVVAGDHYPAARLMEHAHERERSAKAICRGREGARSAFDFAILTSGEAHLDSQRPLPLSLEATTWNETLKCARALQRVPTAQRAVLAERRRLSAEEFENLFLYQVARSKKWQAWFDDCRVKWRDRAVVRHHVGGLRVDLLDLIPSEERGA